MVSHRISRLSNFLSRPASEQLLLLHALGALAAYRIVTCVLGRRRQTRLFGPAIDLAEAAGCTQAIVLDDARVKTVHQVRRTIARGAAILNLRDSCLVEALVARRLLRRYGIPSIMYLGVAEDVSLSAAGSHVWVDAGTIPVTGYPERRSYRSCAAFPVLK